VLNLLDAAILENDGVFVSGVVPVRYLASACWIWWYSCWSVGYAELRGLPDVEFVI